jgi:ribosomal protein L40E
MSKETLGYVKLEWTCPKCGSRNPGPEKICASCGASQPQNVQFQQAGTQEIIKDQAEVEHAKAGPDIHCAFCGARNPVGATVCSQCGADLKEGTVRESGRVVGAFTTGPVKQVACPNCGTMNPETGMKCTQCGSSLASAPAPAAIPQAAASKANPLVIWMLAGIGLVCLAVIIAFFILSTRTQGQNGVVESVKWQTSVIVQGLLPATHSAWKEDIPAEAEIGNCTQKVHHVQDQPDPDANNQKVCGTPYTVDKGSGYAEVVQDCQYEVLMDYCDYSALEWQQVGVVNLEGTDNSPTWPAPQLSKDQRLGAQGQVYTVIFETPKGQQVYTTTDLDLYRQFQIDSVWILNINAFGQIVSVEPAK